MRTRYYGGCDEIANARCGLIKDLKTRYYLVDNDLLLNVVVWLKIWKHDIPNELLLPSVHVVVWLKIWKHDIEDYSFPFTKGVVVWLKIWKHDI